MMVYTLLEDYLSKRLKEPTFLKVMYISHRLTALVFFYASVKGIYAISHLLFLLLISKTPSHSDIISSVLLGTALIFTILFRKTLWYYLTKNKQTTYANWFIQKYASLRNNKETIPQAYECLEKASKLKPDSTFIWSVMAMFNAKFFDKLDLAEEYLAKAQETLNASANPTANDKAVFEAATGDILFCHNKVQEALTHLKNAADLDPASFRVKYEKALEWANQEDEPEERES